MIKAHWLVTLPERPSFSMVGAPMSRAEAIEHVRGIWPQGVVE